MSTSAVLCFKLVIAVGLIVLLGGIITKWLIALYRGLFFGPKPSKRPIDSDPMLGLHQTNRAELQ